MYFCARHYSALSRVYSEMFGQPVPSEVALAAAHNGKAPDLMDALHQATQFQEPIGDWTHYFRPQPTGISPKGHM